MLEVLLAFRLPSLIFGISWDVVMRMVPVKYQDNDVRYLNELEYINGEVWANVFKVSCLLPPSSKC